MKALKERILRDGKCFEGGILKVDNFINHQMDPILMKSMAVEFVRRFASTDINKIITVEASGIAPSHHGGIPAGAPRCLCKEKNAEHNGKYALHLCLFLHQATLLQRMCQQRLFEKGRQDSLHRRLPGQMATPPKVSSIWPNKQKLKSLEWDSSLKRNFSMAAMNSENSAYTWNRWPSLKVSTIAPSK